MRIKVTPLDAQAVAAAGCFAVAMLPLIPTVIANTAATMLCFILVGTLWASAVLPRRASALARFVAVVACGLAGGIIGGLIINLLPSGLVRSNWVIYSILLAAIGYAIARRRVADGIVHWSRSDVGSPSLASAVKVVAAVAVVITAVVMSSNSYNVNEKSFTELWLVPDNDRNSPVRAVHATLGVKSHEAASHDFTVVMNSGSTIVTSRVTLEPQQVWTQSVMVDGPEARAVLYLGDVSDEPYRTVWIARQ